MDKYAYVVIFEQAYRGRSPGIADYAKNSSITVTFLMCRIESRHIHAPLEEVFKSSRKGPGIGKCPI